MEKLIPLFFGLWVALLWLLGNASWILILLNLLWMFFKGGVLFAWWIPFTVLGSFFVLVAVFFAVVLWAKVSK